MESLGTPSFISTSALTVLPGALYMYSPGSHWLASTLVPPILLAHSLCRELRNFLAQIPHMIQPPHQVSPCTEHPGTSWLAPISASTALLGFPQCIEPQDTLACTQFSFSCPDRTCTMWKAQNPQPMTVTASASQQKSPSTHSLHRAQPDTRSFFQV